jgi:hypothetical protein
MIIKHLKHYNPAYFLLIIIIALLFWGYHYFFPYYQFELIIQDEMPLYNFFYKLVVKSNLSFFPLFISFLLILIQLFLVSRLDLKYLLSGSRNFFSSLMFVLFASFILPTNYLSPIIIANIFILLAFNRIFAAYNKEKILSNFFDASFLISIASLFYFNTIFIIPLLFISALMIKSSPVKEWIVIIIAIIMVYAVFTEIYFIIFGEVTSFLQTINNTFFKNYSFGFSNLQFRIAALVFSLLSIISFFYFLKESVALNVSIRVFLRILILFYSIVAIIFILTNSFNYELFLFNVFPLSVIASHFFLNNAKKRIMELFFILLILIVIFVHIVKFFPFLN